MAAAMAGRVPGKLPPSDAALLRIFANTGLRKAHRAEFWTETMNLEGITPSDRLFLLREGDANEIGEIADILTSDPRGTTRFEKVRSERALGVAYVYTAASPVYVYWQTPPVDLLDVADADLAATPIPEIFKEFVAHFAAAYLLFADDKPAAAGQMLALAQNALLFESSSILTPYWRQLNWNPDKLADFTAGGSVGSVTAGNPLLNMQRGTYNIPNGVDSGSVTTAFASAPVGILLTVRPPSGGLLLFANPVAGSYAATGFDFTLNGVTDSADYVLEYVCIF